MNDTKHLDLVGTKLPMCGAPKRETTTMVRDDVTCPECLAGLRGYLEEQTTTTDDLVARLLKGLG